VDACDRLMKSRCSPSMQQRLVEDVVGEEE
jgi:hypothetical protein